MIQHKTGYFIIEYSYAFFNKVSGLSKFKGFVKNQKELRQIDFQTQRRTDRQTNKQIVVENDIVHLDNDRTESKSE